MVLNKYLLAMAYWEQRSYQQHSTAGFAGTYFVSKYVPCSIVVDYLGKVGSASW